MPADTVTIFPAGPTSDMADFRVVIRHDQRRNSHSRTGRVHPFGVAGGARRTVEASRAVVAHDSQKFERPTSRQPVVSRSSAEPTFTRRARNN